MRDFIFIEQENSGDRGQNLLGSVRAGSLFQPGVIGDADASEMCHFLTAQTRHPAGRMRHDVISSGRHTCPPIPQKSTECTRFNHASHRTRYLRHRWAVESDLVSSRNTIPTTITWLAAVAARAEHRNAANSWLSLSREEIPAMPLALLALAVGAFALGTTEFLTNGLLSSLTAEFNVTIANAGLVTTAYAVGQMCGPLLALALLRLPTKRVLLVLMTIFTVGNLSAAISPGFEFLLASRFATAWSHTAFFGVAAVVAFRLVPVRKQASAIALVFTGLTLAMVLGMPLGTLVGQTWGWRASFLIVTLMSAVSLAGIAALVPVDQDHQPAGYRDSLHPFTHPRLWLALTANAIGFGGLFASFTYIEPVLTTVTGFASGNVSWLLGIYGAGLVVGNWLAGKAADRALIPTTVTLMIALAAALGALALGAHSPIVVVPLLFVLGACGFGLLTPLQTFVLRLAISDSPLVSTANTAALGAGVALGSLLGGAVLTISGSFAIVNFAAGGMTLAGLVIYVIVVLTTRRRTSTNPIPDAALAEMK